MIQLKVRNNSGDTVTLVVEGNTTVREAMRQSGMEFGSNGMQVSGTPVIDLDAPISSYANTDSAWLTPAANKNNA